MNRTRNHVVFLSSLACAAMLAAGAALAQQPATGLPDVEVPKPTVPEVFTLQGQFVRIAYNNEGFVTLGYRLANDSVGDEWMYLQVGMTLMPGVPGQTLKREAISVKTPDGTVVPLATQQEYAAASYLPALNRKGQIVKDSLNYFPAGASIPCALQFFADLGSGPNRGVVFDEVGMSDDRACVGRLFFKIPGGIQVGQHWLVVKFAGGEVQVPFRILTPEEAKVLKKQWDELKAALDSGMLE